MKLMCVRSISVVRWAAHPFTTHRRHNRIAASCDSLPITAVRRQAASSLAIGAVGVFSFVHAASVFFFSLFETATDRNT